MVILYTFDYMEQHYGEQAWAALDAAAKFAGQSVVQKLMQETKALPRCVDYWDEHNAGTKSILRVLLPGAMELLERDSVEVAQDVARFALSSFLNGWVEAKREAKSGAWN